MRCPLTGNQKVSIILIERKLTATCAPNFSAISTTKKALLKIVLPGRIPFFEVTALALLITLAFFVFPRINLSALTASISEAPAFVASVRNASGAVAADVDPSGYADDLLVSAEIGFAQGLLEDATRQFYLNLVGGNYRIVQAVYEYGEGLNKDLIFAQMETESRFDPQAFNDNIDKETGLVTSTDRGLFQLNSKSYPDLTIGEFFNIEINVRYGIAHIRGELEYNKGNTRRALWTYNAGRKGILDGVPTRTVTYASDILARTKQIATARDSFIKEKLAEFKVYSPLMTLGLASAIPVAKR
jgi:soluble lytic murein transglycosylase-like protein